MKKKSTKRNRKCWVDIMRRVREYHRAGRGSDKACEDAVNAICKDIKQELAFKDPSLLSNEELLTKKAHTKFDQLHYFFSHVISLDFI